MLKKFMILNMVFLCFTSCLSTKSTIKNIDNTAVKPVIKDGAYVLKEYADSKKYGYDQDYPINIGVIQDKNEDVYVSYFFNGITGPNGENITYKKAGTCCPFPTKYNKIGGGFLAIYEVTWKGQEKPIQLHFNIYERGKIVCPMGFSIKKP